MRNIKLITLASSLLITFCIASDSVEFRLVENPAIAPEGFVWESEVPEDCPFEQSELFNRVYFTGRHSDYHAGDTFYPCWASDDNLYSPWTDGVTDGVRSGSYWGDKATTGHAIMKGDDPLTLVIKNTSPPKHASSLPYNGRYPAGSLVYNGIWYYGTYCLGPAGNYKHNDFTWNWPNLGPMPGFQISYDYGKTWEPSPLSPENPLFPEPDEVFAPVKMGAPHFVDFGKNMQYSPDGKAYLLGMGAIENDPMPRPCLTLGGEGEAFKIVDECPGDKEKLFAHANLSWITADQVYMARVTPSPETINDENAYEYFAGHDRKGKPVWSKNFEDIKPLIEWNNNMGCVTATYVPAIKKYIMCITDGWPTVAKMDSYFLESDNLTGPWKIITYMKDFGEQGYFLNFPSKFIADNGKDMWLCYSANFSQNWNGVKLHFNPPGGRYGICLHEMRFLSKDEKDPTQAVVTMADCLAGNIAPEAKVAASTTYEGYSAAAIVDGKVEGFPENSSGEWASVGEKTGAWVKLEWANVQKVDRVLLFDRPNTIDHILSGLLTFSDGSFIHVDRPLPDNASAGLEVKFDAKTVSWIKFQVLKTNDNASNIGLAEFAVFKAKQPIWTDCNEKADSPVMYDASGELPQGGPAVSSSFSGIKFTGRYSNYTKADTWYPTWASDGNLYSPWTDGTIGEMEFVWSAKRDKAETGYAKISGDDPLNLTISDWGTRIASALPFQGRYPCGSLFYNGVWYYGTYGLDQPAKEMNSKFGWYVLGPLVGFSYSEDYGKTWTETPHTTDNPLFPEVSRDSLDLKEGKEGPFIKMGAPHFVDFGKNMEYSPDGKAYLVGHGAEFPDTNPRVANNSWVTGDAVYLSRVIPSIENINDGSKYEFFAGNNRAGKPIWTNDFKKIKPIFSWNNHAGIVTMTYNAPLKKYFMCITDGHIGTTSRKEYTSYILESNNITGPWAIVSHMKDFGPQAYFLNIPSKFISYDGKTMWLCYSANYMDKNRNDHDRIIQTTPNGSGYSLSLHEFIVQEN